MSSASPKGPIDSVLDKITAASGMAVVIVDRNTHVVAMSNDNSICRVLNPPDTFVGACAEDCGRAFERTKEAGAPVDYECHAGLQCRSVPLGTGNKQLVAITGRTFVKASNYRQATARAASGDWRSFPPTKIFENVILSGSASELNRLDSQVTELNKDLLADIGKRSREISISAAEPVTQLPVIEQPAGKAVPDPFESSLLNYKIEPEQQSAEAQPDPFASSMMNFRLETV